MRFRALVLTFALLGACAPAGGNGAGTGADAASVSDRYVAAVHTMYCEYLTCAYGFSSAGGCVISDESDEALSKSLAAGRQQLDTAKAEACIALVDAGLDGRACWGTSEVGRRKLEAAVEVCLGAASAAVAVGGACFANEECAGGFCDLTACPGTCRAPRAAGEKCLNARECAPGTECLGDGETRCTGVAAKGAACDDSRPCESGLECFQSVCSEPYLAGPGENCVRDAHCGAGAVCTGLQVDGGGSVLVYGRCTAKGSVGAECAQSGFLFFIASPDCAGAQVCAGLVLDDNGGVKTSGRCALPSDVGGRCHPGSTMTGGGADGCYFGLLCDPATELCAIPPKAGSACIAGNCGRGAYCDGTMCVPFKKAGETCGSSMECEGSCAGGRCIAPESDTSCRAP